MVMKKVLALKHRIGVWTMHHRMLFGVASKLNLILFQYPKRQYDKKFGKLNPSLKFCVIRPLSITAGLCNVYLLALRDIINALNDKMLPVVDFLNYKTQYNVDFPVNGTYNAWEYYFEQPCNYTLEEVYKSRNVRLSGWTFTPPRDIVYGKENLTKFAPIKQYIYDIADEKIKADGISNMIGLLIRGTDYTQLKPLGHAIPPTAEQAAEKLDEFLAKYGERKIFLATEDENIYAFFKNKYGDMIYTTDKNFITYSGSDYIVDIMNKTNTSMYQFGLDYLVKIICLSKCMCLISSITGGTVLARMLNEGRYVENYNFDLGAY